MYNEYTLSTYRPSRSKRPKLNQQSIRVLCAELGKGNTVEFSCRKAGFSAQTLYRQTQIKLAKGDVYWIHRWMVWHEIGKHWPDADDEFKMQRFLEISEGVLTRVYALQYPTKPSAEIVRLDDWRKVSE